MSQDLVLPGKLLLDQKIPMRDNINLSADIWLPDNGPGPWPVLLLRTIYDKQETRYINWARGFNKNGYAVVMQDARGRGDSDGEWDPYRCELNDGFDTHEWVGKQKWCNGKIGTFGLSYPGFTQTYPATLRSKYLKALVPIASQQDNYGHHRINGVIHYAVTLAFLNMVGRTVKNSSLQYFDFQKLVRHLPIKDAFSIVAKTHPYYKGVMEHESYDKWWSEYSLRSRYNEVDVPAMFVTGWYDSLLHENFKLFNGWTKKSRTDSSRSLTKLIVGPWSHQVSPWGRLPLGDEGEYQDRVFGNSALWDIVDMHLRWYDARLKNVDTGIDEEPPIKLFVMGKNYWRHEREWPLARTKWTNLYLDKKNLLSFSTSVENRIANSFIYDPKEPVPSWGAQYQTFDLCGPRDRRNIESRPDVLVYSTNILEFDLEVTGPVRAIIYASSSAIDTDFTATLVDVEEDGKAIILCEGIVRTRFRNGTDNPEMISPDQVYKFEIEMWETSNVFKSGHRIRMEISSSNFPRYNRNLNTGNVIETDTQLKKASQTIYSGYEYPSHIVLPVIPS